MIPERAWLTERLVWNGSPDLICWLRLVDSIQHTIIVKSVFVHHQFDYVLLIILHFVQKNK